MASFGLSYFKNLINVFKDIKFIPTGGIDSKNMADYLNHGAFALGMGSSLFSSKETSKKDYLGNLKKRCKKIQFALKTFKNS